MHQTYDGFHYILKKHLKLSQKIDFLAHFERLLVYAFLHPTCYTLVFCQIKHLIEVHNRGKFHQCNICGCQVINFQMFSWPCSIHEMAPFDGFLGPFSRKYDLSFLKFRPEVRLSQDKHSLWTIFQNQVFKRKRDVPKFMILVYFWAQFTSRKPKILPKTKIFSRNYILMTIK